LEGSILLLNETSEYVDVLPVGDTGEGDGDLELEKEYLDGLELDIKPAVTLLTGLTGEILLEILEAG
jgi:hypothetical protein